MQSKPYVTYHVNTFNRCHLLKNLLRSFEECNEYPNFEWVIMDYGSTDGTRDFIFDYMKSRDYVSVIFGNQNKYFEILSSKGIEVPSARKAAHSIFGMTRNAARQVGRGDLFIDVADDHQFIRRGDWVQEMLDIFDHRRVVNGADDISSILYRGLSYDRINKPNNDRCPMEVTPTGVEYYRCMHKRYDDYHMMKRSTYHQIGPYFEVDMEDDAERLKEWCAGKDDINHYCDYLDRTAGMSLQKVFMKYPYTIDFPNHLHDTLNQPCDTLIFPLVDSEKMKKGFAKLDRPVSSDEIFASVG